MYAGDDDPDDQSLFMIEKIAFQNLCEGLLQPCGCTSMRGSWKLSSFVKVLSYPCQKFTDWEWLYIFIEGSRSKGQF